MVDIEKTGSKPQEFMRLYGITYAGFKILLGKIEAHVQAQKQANPISRRGRKASLGVAAQLLLTLVYLRQSDPWQRSGWFTRTATGTARYSGS